MVRAAKVTLNRSRGRRVKAEAGFTGGGFWKPTSGRNVVRVFMFEHVVTEDDFENRLYLPEEAEVGQTSGEWVYEGAVHFGGGDMMNCSGRDCPRCKLRKELMQELGSDDKRVKDLKPSRRFYMNAVPVNEKSPQMAIWGAPQTVYEAIASIIFDPDYEDVIEEEVFGYEGRDFIVEYDPSETPANMYQVKLRDANRCVELDSDTVGEPQDLFAVEVLQPGWSKADKKGDKASRSRKQQESAPEKAEEPEEPTSSNVDPEEVLEEIDGMKKSELTALAGSIGLELPSGAIKAVVKELVTDWCNKQLGNEPEEKEEKPARRRAAAAEEPEDPKAAVAEDPENGVGLVIEFNGADDDGKPVKVHGKVTQIDDGLMVVPASDGYEYTVKPDGDWSIYDG
jgi:hypothetical protein